MLAESLLEHEIGETGDVLERLWAEERDVVCAVGREVRARGPRLCVLVARGTSDHAATYGKYLLEAVAGLPVALAAPSLFTLYRTPPYLEGALVLALSQSGASPDLIEVMRAARRQGAMTVAVVNRGASPLAAAAEHVIACHAGDETSVAATKSYTAELMALAMLVGAMSPDSELFGEIEGILPAVHEAVALGPQIQAAVGGAASTASQCLVAARGYQYASALELALKLKEMGRVYAQGYSAADLRHGPITLVGPDLPIVLISSHGPSAKDLIDLADDCRALDAPVWGMTDDPELASKLSVGVTLPGHVPEPLAPIVTAPALQWWAYATARSRGIDPNHPVGIQKVTRTL